MQEDKRGFHNLAGEENLPMLTILRASLEYVACCCPLSLSLPPPFFLVKLVFYCVVIDNYYLCFGAVPKVAKNFFKPPLRQEMAPFHGCTLFSSSV